MAASFLGKLLVKIEGDNSSLDKSVKKSEGSVKKFSKFAVAGYAAVGVAIIAMGKKAVRAFKIQEQAEAKLNATIKSTGSAAGLTSKELTNMASALQKVTKYGDEEIIGAESLLLTFKSIGKDVFPQALESILDVSEAMGQGLKESTVQLGKALNDPIQGLTALRRVGIQFTDSQEETIKSMVGMNDIAGAQNIILEEMQSQFGGVARAAADTATGSIDQLENSIGDLNEQIGRSIAEGLQPMAKATTSLVSGLVDWINKNREVNDFLKEMSENGSGANASMETLTATLKRLQKEQADQMGLNDDLAKQIILTQGLIDKKQMLEAMEKRYAGLKGEEKKQAAIDIQNKQAEIEATKELTKLKFDALTSDQQEIQLLQEKIDKYAALRTGGADVQALLNELIRQRNALQSKGNKDLEEQEEIVTRLASAHNLMGVEAIESTNNINDGLKEQIDILGELKDNWQSFGSGTISLINAIDDLQSASADAELQRMEDAGASQEELDAKKRQIAHDEAIRKKNLGILNTGIDTASAIIGFLANPGGFAGIALSALAGVTGAVQLAAINAMPIPALAEGGVLAPATGGVPAVMAEAGVPEMAMPLNSTATDPFADKIASRINSSTTNNTQNFNSMFSLNDENKMREAARRLFPFMQDEELRRGITV